MTLAESEAGGTPFSPEMSFPKKVIHAPLSMLLMHGNWHRLGETDLYGVVDPIAAFESSLVSPIPRRCKRQLACTWVWFGTAPIF